MIRHYNRRRFKKLLKKEFGGKFNIKSFNLLVVGKMVIPFNATLGESIYGDVRVIGFSAKKICLPYFPTDWHFACEFSYGSEYRKGSFMLKDYNAISNSCNANYIKIAS